MNQGDQSINNGRVFYPDESECEQNVPQVSKSLSFDIEVVSLFFFDIQKNSIDSYTVKPRQF